MCWINNVNFSPILICLWQTIFMLEYYKILHKQGRGLAFAYFSLQGIQNY